VGLRLGASAGVAGAHAGDVSGATPGQTVLRLAPCTVAIRTALRDFGGLAQTREAVRDVRTIWLDSAWRDLRHAARPDQLTAAEWAAFCADLYIAQNAVMSVTRPDHINVESLGNVVPHLHWHIVPRYVGDPRWGMPIWTTPLSAMPDTRLEASDRGMLLRELREALAVG